VKATEVTAGLAESNGSLLLDLWRDSLHVTCGVTACTPGSAPGPTLGNEYGKTLTFLLSEFGALRRGYYLWAFGSCLVRSFTQDASVFAACTER